MNESQKSLTELLAELAQKHSSISWTEVAKSPEKISEILRNRAQVFRDLEVESDSSEHLEILEFTLQNQHFAFPLHWVGEVCRVAEIIDIPGTPAFVKGVINLRRKIFSVIDLSVLLALDVNPGDTSESLVTNSENSEDNLLLTLISSEMEFAVVIDSLLGVNSLPVRDIQESLPTLSGAQADYFKGLTLEHLVILDAEKLLLDKKLVVNV